MLSQKNLSQTIYEIETLGFSVVPDVISSESVKELRSALLVAIEDDQTRWRHLPGKSADLIENLIVHGGPFLGILDTEVMHQVFSNFLGETCILYNYGSTFLLPNGTPPSMEIHTDMPRLVKNYHSGLIMTLALDEFNSDNGATVYLPGSQILERRPTLETFERYCVSVARKAGDAVFFNPRCFHRASPNDTNEIRCGLTVYAVRHFMKQRFDFPRMISTEIASRLTSKARQFIGFDSRIPTKMEEYYTDVGERLYKPGQG